MSKNYQIKLMSAAERTGVQFVMAHLYLAAREVLTLVVHLFNAHFLSRKYRKLVELKVNFGCGPKYKSGWLNIDFYEGSDLRLDLRKNLPLPDECCSLCYSEHFFEHLSFPDDANRHLSECKRILTPGGELHIGVPNAGSAMLSYAKIHNEGRLDDAFTRYWAHPNWVNTRMEAINFLFRQNYLWFDHQHMWAYDFLSLKLMLERCGFINVKQRDFDPTLDSENRKGGLYVCATKP